MHSLTQKSGVRCSRHPHWLHPQPQPQLQPQLQLQLQLKHQLQCQLQVRRAPPMMQTPRAPLLRQVHTRHLKVRVSGESSVRRRRWMSCTGKWLACEGRSWH